MEPIVHNYFPADEGWKVERLNHKLTSNIRVENSFHSFSPLSKGSWSYLTGGSGGSNYSGSGSSSSGVEQISSNVLSLQQNGKESALLSFLLTLRYVELSYAVKGEEKERGVVQRESYCNNILHFKCKGQGIFSILAKHVEENSCYFCGKQTTSNQSFLCTLHNHDNLLELYKRASKETVQTVTEDISLQLLSQEEELPLSEKEKEIIAYSPPKGDLSTQRSKDILEFRKKEKFGYITKDLLQNDLNKGTLPTLLTQLYNSFSK